MNKFEKKLRIKAARELDHDKREVARFRKAGIPSCWQLQVDANLTIQAADKESGLPRFEMLAYTGVPMRQWFGTVIVDLAGLRASGKMPILWAHNPDLPIAHAEKTSKADGALTASGVVSGDPTDEFTRKFVALSKNGFPFQASIGAEIDKLVRLQEGKKTMVNGQEIEGPMLIARQATLREISVVVNGADPNTSSTVAANQIENHFLQEKDMNFEAWLKAKGIEAEGLAAGVLAVIKAQYEAEIKASKPEPQKETGKEIKPEIEAVKSPDPAVAVRAEYARISAIEAACKVSDDMPEDVQKKLEEIRATAIDKEWSAEKAQLAALRASRVSVPSVHVKSDSIAAETLSASIAIQGGVKAESLVKGMGEKTIEAAYKHRRMGLKDIIRAACALEGVSLPADSGSNDWIRAAMSTNAVSGIVGSAVEKVLLNEYQQVPSVARQVASVIPVSNFKQYTLYRLTGDNLLEKVNASNEIQHGTVGEESSSVRADTYGKMITLTRTMIIDDDLGAFMTIPKRLGRGAAETIEKTFFTVLLANASNFFHANNKNYISGATTALNQTSLGTALKTFRDQTDADGNPISVNPSILLVPTALEMIARELFTSPALIVTGLASTSTASKAPAVNLWQNAYRPLVSPYLANSNITGYSATAWYLLDPNFAGIAYLNGVELPTVEEVTMPANQLGMGWRVVHDFGAGLTDHRLGVKSAGA